MKAMLIKWAWRLSGAFIGLLLGGGLALLLGDPIAKILEISNFEGARGYFIVLVLVPLFAMSGAVLGAIMIHLPWQWNLGISFLLLIGVGGFLFSQREQWMPIPPQVETLGNFELRTYTSESRGEYYQLRYRGEPFSIEGRAGMFGDQSAVYTTFNSVITFTLPMSIPAPVFVVNVGDPNNSSFFYLVREVDGQATVTHLSDTSGGNVSADWLDNALLTAATSRNLTLHRGRLTGGGRWLLLGDNCVLDMQTLTPYRFATYPLGDGADVSLNQFTQPLGLSPDQRSFVRLGSSDVRDWGTEEFRGYVARLIVFDFVDGASYTLPIDRLQMRYSDVTAIDHAWLTHHFEWQRQDGAHDRLVQRANFTPLPYQGYFYGEGQDLEYRLVPVKPELIDKLVAFLEQKLEAVRLETKRYETSTYIDLQIGEQTVHVGYSSDGYSEPQIGVWLDWQSSKERNIIEEIAQQFDEVLRTGVYDALFLGDPVAVMPPVIEGVAQFTNLSQEHTQEPVQYEQTPPVGGKHRDQWLNCGVYTTPVENEMAVHSLEHGAVWITYQPTLPADQIEQLQALTKAGPYRLLSPYPGLPSPIVISAWGLQLQVADTADPRLATFVQTYENRKDGPEYGASCQGGVGTPAS